MISIKYLMFYATEIEQFIYILFVSFYLIFVVCGCIYFIENDNKKKERIFMVVLVMMTLVLEILFTA